MIAEVLQQPLHGKRAYAGVTAVYLGWYLDRC